MADAPKVVVKSLNNGTLKLKDGTAVTPLEITFPVLQGGLSMKYKGAGKSTVQVLDRGALAELIEGADEPMEWSIDALCRELIQTTGGAPVTPHEFVTFTGGAAAYLSTNTDGGAVKTFNIECTIAGVVAAQAAEVITIPRCYDVSVEWAESPSGNTLKLSGKAKATRPTIAKAAG